MRKTSLIFLLFFFLLPLYGQKEEEEIRERQFVDYRFAPEWYQSCISLPDDSYKTIVGPLGQFLYDYGGQRFFKWIEDGYKTVIHFQADENARKISQRLYSARVPIVITRFAYDGLDITQEAFAIGLDYVRNKVSTKDGNREDVIVTTVSNHTDKVKIFRPVLIINSEQKVQVEDRTVTLREGHWLLVSEKPSMVRQNLSDVKTLMSFDAIRINPGEKKKMIVLYNNGMPSRLADRFGEDPTSLVAVIENTKNEMIGFWERQTDIPYDHIRVPDVEIQNLVDASLRGIWQAREIKNNHIAFQVGPTRYRGLWIVDGAFLLETATMFNRGVDARDGIEYTLSFQKEDGSFEVMNTYYKENGFVLWTCVRHAMLMQDKEWLRKVWLKLRKTVDFIKVLRARTLENDTPLDDGLIPPGMIDGGLWGGKDVPEYTNVYWNLVGLKAMIQAAHWLGEKKEAKAWQKEYDDFFAVFQKSAKRDLQTDSFGNVYLPVTMDPKDHSLPQRAQWAFCLSVYPGQIFEKEDPIAVGTMNMLHTTLQEGVVMGTGWHIDGIWNYFAGFYGQACLWVGERERAYQSLYAFANHASPLYMWREEQAPKDFNPAKYVGDMPHNWASAEFLSLALHLLEVDRGDELHLLEGIPEEWLQPGMVTSLKDIATPFGKLSFTLEVDGDGKTASLQINKLSGLCKRLVVHLNEWGDYDGKRQVSLDPKKEHHLTIHCK